MAIRRAGAAALAFTTAVLATIAGTASPAAAEDEVRYVPPVDAPVIDAFRPPATPFGAGNRGLTYDLPPGSPVTASAGGEVVYAGPVAGTLHVTVLHDDGLRTSYSFLESVSVQRGQWVAQGAVVGTAGGGFHLGARAGDAYLDPAALFEGTEVRVRLIPHEEPLPRTDAGLLRERIALVEKVRERGLLDRVKGVVVRGIEIAGAGLEVYEQLKPSVLAFESGENLVGGLLARLDCTSSGTPIPEVDADGRVALLVAGHNSTSDVASVDDLHLDELGYRDGDVLRYSYAGGRVPQRGLDPALAAIAANPYDEAETWGDIRAEGRAMADLIEEVAEARPGAPIDIYAHSQGGLVTRVAMEELAGRPGGLDVLGQVVTMGTPHDGTDIATGAQIIDGPERDSIEWLADAVGAPLDTDAVSVQQMSEGSEFVFDLRISGIPDGVDFRTVGARGDLVVTGDKTAVAGRPHAMLDLTGPAAHHAIPAADTTTRELRLGLAGLPPTCRGVGDVLLDATVPEGISYAENGLIAGYAV